jgi:hypothetical protein
MFKTIKLYDQPITLYIRFGGEAKDDVRKALELSKDAVVFVEDRHLFVCYPARVSPQVSQPVREFVEALSFLRRVWNDIPQKIDGGFAIFESFSPNVENRQIKLDVYYKEKKIPSQLYVYGKHSKQDGRDLSYAIQALAFAIGSLAVPKVMGNVKSILGVVDLEEDTVFAYIETSDENVIIDGILNTYADFVFIDELFMRPAKVLNRKDALVLVTNIGAYVFSKKEKKVTYSKILDVEDVESLEC